MTLFPNYEDVTTDGAERARDFLLDLDHPQASLTLVVVEGHAGIVYEGQEIAEAIEQVLGW